MKAIVGVIVVAGFALIASVWVRTTHRQDLLMGDGVVYHGQVDAVVRDHCVSCHRADGPAPFSLETYTQVFRRRGDIRRAITSGEMPYWLPDPSVGEWSNARRLSAADTALILAWLRQGAPEGDSAAAIGMPPQHAWMFGFPDAVVTVPEPVAVPARGVVPYTYAFVRTEFEGDRWIRGFEIRPTVPDVVHHILVFIEEPGDEGEMFVGSSVRDGFELGHGGWFAAYVPGYQGVFFPAGTAKRLPAGASLKFQLHYTPNGTALTDQTQLGLFFADAPPERELHTGAVTSVDFEIPPGARAHEVTAVHRFEEETEILGLAPHMHLRGAAFSFELHAPAGERTLLLSLPRWDFRIQDEYWLAEPITAPRGSWLRATGWFDNSSGNALNPDPTATVRFGEQTFEEMMNGYFHYSVPLH